MPFSRILRACLMAALPVLMPAGVVRAEEGVTADSVTFAQVAVLEGPAAALGQGMKAGIEAAFGEANAAGGVHGRRILLESEDDGYEPDRSVQAVKAVLERNDAIALIGAVGTATSTAAQPVAGQAQVPFIGPLTGAGALREPGRDNVFNLRASYAAETEAWVAYLVDDLGLSEIGVLYQDDGFGRSGLDGVTRALAERGKAPVAQGSYIRNTTAVKTALLTLRKARPQAVVMVGASKPVAEFVRLCRMLEFTPTFVAISFGGDGLVADLGPEGEGLIVSQVVPYPGDPSLPLVARYQAALAAHAPGAEPGFVSLEGYMVGRLALAALQAAGRDLSRSALQSALEGQRVVDLDGLTLTFGPDDNQGMDQVFLTRAGPDGQLLPLATGAAAESAESETGDDNG
ncbi:ABC transporter substrate-binding protein [Pseudooceanicola marinus]|uniref:ABC transporter substrate-binding protein n=1 Tax=Pseudooceanicola marinus TaxID=396013 RepID=UPI001CD50957|nr:ABC transporter substrate-binding protein [Pseudooceanicola marinus]MCA1336731.1 ABC transporter substrate-binding protein [Pseudooceanicola marinus]